MNTVELVFFNHDAEQQQKTTLHVSRDRIEPIMAWYGAYYSGDRYNVFVDGKRVEKDQNGARIQPTIDIEPASVRTGECVGMPWLTEDDVP